MAADDGEALDLRPGLGQVAGHLGGDQAAQAVADDVEPAAAVHRQGPRVVGRHLLDEALRWRGEEPVQVRDLDAHDLGETR